MAPSAAFFTRSLYKTAAQNLMPDDSPPQFALRAELTGNFEQLLYRAIESTLRCQAPKQWAVLLGDRG